MNKEDVWGVRTKRVKPQSLVRPKRSKEREEAEWEENGAPANRASLKLLEHHCKIAGLKGRD